MMDRTNSLKTLVLKFIEGGDSLKAKIAKGTMWMCGLQFFQRGLRLVQTIILARILAPENIGLIGIATIATGALDIFSQTGFDKALVQRKKIDDDFLNTAWTLAIIRGAFLFLIIFFSAHLVCDFFDAPKALLVIQILALSFLINGFRNIGTIYFSKNLQFHKKFIWEISSVLSGVTVTISLVFILRNEWAIVWGMLSSNIVSMAASYFMHPYRPRLRFQINIARSLFGYGKWILFTGMAIFLSKQGDSIVLTKLLGVTQLGIYMMALRFAQLPTMVTGIARSVLFPAYASIQEDVQRLKNIYLKFLSVVAFLCTPAVGGIIVLAKPFVLNFLGEKWGACIVPMKILALAILLKIFTDSSAALFNAYGKPEFTFRLILVRVVTLMVVIFPLTQKFGINGVAFSFLISTLSSVVLWIVGINKFFQISIKEFKVLILPTCCTISLLLGIHYFSLIVPLNNVLNFLSAIVTGVIIYIVPIVIIFRFTKIKVLPL